MKNILYILTFFLACACGQDEDIVTTSILENETISGTVLFEDGTLCCPGEEVLIIQFAIDDSLNIDTLSSTGVNEDGSYLFNNILPGTDDLYIQLAESRRLLSSKDDTPDGDLFEDHPDPNLIGVFLEENENDDGNNFVKTLSRCELSLISGNVYGEVNDRVIRLSQPVEIRLYDTDDNGDLTDLIASTTTNDSYRFEVDNNVNAVLEIDDSNLATPPVAYRILDESPDDDPLGATIIQLPAYVDSCEVDSDNNFYLVFNPENPTRISGFALIDTNEDGQGDLAAAGQRIELYNRNSENVPMTPLVDAQNTAADGSFVFNDITPGEYVLYYIGDGSYEAIEGFDEDQEAGEPNNNIPHFISVDIPNESSVDENNVFVLAANASCDLDFELLPWWALCDTSQLCTYDEVPIFVADENFDPITSAGGFYSFVWKDLITGESTVGDWAYYRTNRTLLLELTSSDGCQYKRAYHRECDQDLYGEFSMRVMTTGFGPTFNYEVGEVQWTFDPFSASIVIGHDITNPDVNVNLIPAGNYTYEIGKNGDDLELFMQSLDTGVFYEPGVIRFDNGQLILDDDIPADGIGRYFEKN